VAPEDYIFTQLAYYLRPEKTAKVAVQQHSTASLIIGTGYCLLNEPSTGLFAMNSKLHEDAQCQKIIGLVLTELLGK